MVGGSQKKLKQSGFTIIEVVLVLAIAGLIFLVVFLALPALQKGQRDTQRKNDLSRFLSQLANYQSNNQGNIPGSQSALTDFVTRYLTVGGETFNDPTTGNIYFILDQTSNPTATPANPGDIFYYRGARCRGESAPSMTGTARQVAVSIKLERGTLLCQQN